MHPVFLRHSSHALRAALLLCCCCGLLLLLLAPPADARQRRRQPHPTPPPPPAERLLHAVPSPRSVLGFEPGDDRRVADWAQIRDYFARLDRASDRLQVETVGETTLGKPLIVAIISAPENIRELPKYKDVQRRLADPRGPGDGDVSREDLLLP